MRRRTWGGPALERPAECKDLGLHSGELYAIVMQAESESCFYSANLEVMQLMPLRLTVPEIDRKASLPETITVRSDDFDRSVCMSIDEFEEAPSFLNTPST